MEESPTKKSSRWREPRRETRSENVQLVFTSKNCWTGCCCISRHSDPAEGFVGEGGKGEQRTPSAVWMRIHSTDHGVIKIAFICRSLPFVLPAIEQMILAGPSASVINSKSFKDHYRAVRKGFVRQSIRSPPRWLCGFYNGKTVDVEDQRLGCLLICFLRLFPWRLRGY